MKREERGRCGLQWRRDDAIAMNGHSREGWSQPRHYQCMNTIYIDSNVYFHIEWNFVCESCLHDPHSVFEYLKNMQPLALTGAYAVASPWNWTITWIEYSLLVWQWFAMLSLPLLLNLESKHPDNQRFVSLFVHNSTPSLDSSELMMRIVLIVRVKAHFVNGIYMRSGLSPQRDISTSGDHCDCAHSTPELWKSQKVTSSRSWRLAYWLLDVSNA